MSRDGSWTAGWVRAAALLPACAGLMGALGVAVCAAAAHAGGGSPLATTGGLFLLLHAGAVLGLAVLARGRRRFAVAALLLVVGAVLFSGDLAFAGLAGLRPFPPAAPIGGLLMIAGWVWLALAGAALAVSGEV